MYKVSAFYHMAEKYRHKPTEADKIEILDITEIFLQELEEMIKNEELINININGQVRKGKSTAGIAIGQIIWNILQRNKKQSTNRQFGTNNIARDQIEYTRFMQNEDNRNTVIVVDESNALEKGGENVTVENQLRQVFSDVQAARYCHVIWCSPKDVLDDNSDIMLSVIAIDKKSKETICKLYYRYYEGGEEHIYVLGHVRIYVGHLLINWEEIREDYVKGRRIKEVKEIAKRDFYVDYMIKKYQKMELLTKHGIFRARKLDYAPIILEIAQELIPLTRITNINMRDVIKTELIEKSKRHKIPFSIVGEEWITRDIHGYLQSWKAFYQLRNKETALETKFNNPKYKGNREILEEQLEDVKAMKHKVQRTIDRQLSTFKQLAKLQRDYTKMISGQ